MDGAEESGVGEGPLCSVEFFVSDVDEINVVEVLPVDFASIQIGDTVGVEVGDLDFESVFTVLQQAADGDAEGQADEPGYFLSIETDVRGFADLAQIK